jgi:hypothetical protein
MISTTASFNLLPFPALAMLEQSKDMFKKSQQPAATNTATQIVDEPLENDILCGRGKVVSDHIGNHRFQIIIAMKLQCYDEANRIGKTKIVLSLVRDILNCGGRFLKKDSNGEWYDSGYLGARSKVAHSIRDALSDRNKSILFIKEKVYKETTVVCSSASSPGVLNCTQNCHDHENGDSDDDSSIMWQCHEMRILGDNEDSMEANHAEKSFDDDFTSLPIPNILLGTSSCSLQELNGEFDDVSSSSLTECIMTAENDDLTPLCWPDDFTLANNITDLCTILGCNDSFKNVTPVSSFVLR